MHALSIDTKSSLQIDSSKLSSDIEEARSEPTENQNSANTKDHEDIMNGEVGSQQSKEIVRKHGGKGSSANNGDKFSFFGPRSQDNGSLKVKHHILC